MSAVPRLLYVDSDADTAATRAETLSSDYEFQVRTASGVATAQTALAANDIDCVISDFRLGDNDGLELLSHVRSEYSSLPVILLIDDEPEEIARDAFNSGATDLFPRSMIELSYEPLVSRINELTGETSEAVTKASASGNRQDSATAITDEEMAASTDGGGTEAAPNGTASSTPAEVTPSETTAGPEAPGTTTANQMSDDRSISDLDIDQLRALPKDELVALLAKLIGDTDEPATESAEAMANSIDPTGGAETETGSDAAPTTDKPTMTDSGSPADTATESAATATTASAAETTAVDAADTEWETDGDYRRPPALDLSPGATVLVQCGSQDARKHDARQDLLGVTEASNRNVLLIQYRAMNTDRLATIAEAAQRVKVITVGCSQTVPNTVSNTVEVVNINNPNDVTRLGILSTKTLDDWQALDGGIAVSLDPLDVLFRYKSVEGTFRFLHIFLGKLSAGGAVSSFFVNPSASNPQDVNTLKPLFDHILTVDAGGVDLEGT